MSWTTPQYSKTQVDVAGTTLVDPSASRQDHELALQVVNNWRSSHSFPLNTFQVTLRKRARQVDPDALVAQRIKRLPSISAKLRRFDTMRLSRMQDIGGCRAVVTGMSDVDALTERYRTSRFNHTLVRDDDYQRDPKRSGYRSVHLVYRYYSDRKQTYNGLLIEVQLRSRLQHAWATAVETVGTFTRQALKSSHGEAEWLRFFALMGSEHAHRENCPSVPGTPQDRSDLRHELRELATSLDVVRRLEVYGSALHVLTGNTELIDEQDHYFLLELNTAQQTLAITGYVKGQLAQASDHYEAAERASDDDPYRDVVLVSAESLTALKRAYPNYFLDTTEFLTTVKEATQE